MWQRIMVGLDDSATPDILSIFKTVLTLSSDNIESTTVGIKRGLLSPSSTHCVAVDLGQRTTIEAIPWMAALRIQFNMSVPSAALDRTRRGPESLPC